MRAEIISVGSELLLGHTINSDAALVARMLAELGIDVLNVQMVGDNPERLTQALELAASRSDVIITTGGLGPTDDDLTKTTIARFAGVNLVEDEVSRQRLLEYFGSREIGANQLRQALLPAGCVPFANENGTAPGCGLRLAGGQHVLMLPGPPREVGPMLKNAVRPYLEKLSSGIIQSSSLHVFGMGEGAAAQRIADLMAGANPSVAPYAHDGEMFVKITAKAANAGAAAQLMRPVIEEVKERLGEYVYAIDVSTLEAVVVELLSSRGLTVATAESCTGGLLAKRITDLPGASKVFHAGFITYSNQAKEKELDVPHGTLEAHGAVSPETAREMATNVRRIAGADFGVGITGIAGPDGGTPQKPVGLVYIALAHARGCEIRKMEPTGRTPSRAFIRQRASSHALDMLRRLLAGLPVDMKWI